jgi:hypothetical protein
MLVRRAVVATRQRLALAGRALARVRLALSLVAKEVELLGRQAVEELVRQPHVRLDHLVDPKLIVEREVLPYLREQRADRLGEVATVHRETEHRRLTGVEHALLVVAPRWIVRILDHHRPQLPKDGTTELVHLSLPLFSGLPLRAFLASSGSRRKYRSRSLT